MLQQLRSHQLRSPSLGLILSQDGVYTGSSSLTLHCDRILICMSIWTSGGIILWLEWSREAKQTKKFGEMFVMCHFDN